MSIKNKLSKCYFCDKQKLEKKSQQFFEDFDYETYQDNDDIYNINVVVHFLAKTHTYCTNIVKQRLSEVFESINFHFNNYGDEDSINILLKNKINKLYGDGEKVNIYNDKINNELPDCSSDIHFLLSEIYFYDIRQDLVTKKNILNYDIIKKYIKTVRAHAVEPGILLHK